VTDPQPIEQTDPGVPGGEPTAATGPTAHPAVDAALEQLDGVAGQPPAEQVAAFEAAHRTLTGTLSAIDSS